MVSVPFRNPITSLGGTLVLPSLRSPDFAYTPSPSYDITGWSIANNPSEVYAETLYTEHTKVPVPSGLYFGRYWDLADMSYLQSPVFASPKQSASISTVTLTTSNQDLLGTGNIFYEVPPGAFIPPYRIMVIYHVRAICDFQAIAAPTGAAVARLQVTPATNGVPGTTTTVSTPQALFAATGNGQRFTVTQEWLIGRNFSGPDYEPPIGTDSIDFGLVGVANTAAVYRSNSVHTKLVVTPSIKISYSG